MLSLNGTHVRVSGMIGGKTARNRSSINTRTECPHSLGVRG